MAPQKSFEKLVKIFVNSTSIIYIPQLFFNSGPHALTRITGDLEKHNIQNTSKTTACSVKYEAYDSLCHWELGCIYGSVKGKPKILSIWGAVKMEMKEFFGERSEK